MSRYSVYANTLLQLAWFVFSRIDDSTKRFTVADTVLYASPSSSDVFRISIIGFCSRWENNRIPVFAARPIPFMISVFFIWTFDSSSMVSNASSADSFTARRKIKIGHRLFHVRTPLKLKRSYFDLSILTRITAHTIIVLHIISYYAAFLSISNKNFFFSKTELRATPNEREKPGGNFT